MMRSERTGALVLGVGNLLWADEGFGVRCMEAFANAYHVSDDVELVEGGTQGLLLVSFLQRRRDLILFDAVDFGDAPGALRLVEGRAIPSFIAARAMSLHQTGMADVLACADLMGAFPDRALLIGVQPHVLEDYGGSLTDCVRARVDQSIAIAARRLREWGYSVGDGPSAEALFDASLQLRPYEAGRPSAEDACRFGDERVLARSVQG